MRRRVNLLDLNQRRPRPRAGAGAIPGNQPQDDQGEDEGGNAFRGPGRPVGNSPQPIWLWLQRAPHAVGARVAETLRRVLVVAAQPLQIHFDLTVAQTVALMLMLPLTLLVGPLTYLWTFTGAVARERQLHLHVEQQLERLLPLPQDAPPPAVTTTTTETDPPSSSRTRLPDRDSYLHQEICHLLHAVHSADTNPQHPDPHPDLYEFVARYHCDAGTGAVTGAGTSHSRHDDVEAVAKVKYILGGSFEHIPPGEFDVACGRLPRQEPSPAEELQMRILLSRIQTLFSLPRALTLYDIYYAHDRHSATQHREGQRDGGGGGGGGDGYAKLCATSTSAI